MELLCKVNVTEVKRLFRKENLILKIEEKEREKLRNFKDFTVEKVKIV
jgi:hypothetical protein